MTHPPIPIVGTAPGGLEPHRGTLILVLGILSLTVLCGLFTGIPAWIMGKGDLDKDSKAAPWTPKGEGIHQGWHDLRNYFLYHHCSHFGAFSYYYIFVGGGLAALSN